MPAAHLLTVLKVAGATTTASGAGKGRGSSGRRHAERIGRPVCVSTAAASKKPFIAVGVAMTPTSQSRSCAAVISLLTSAATPAAQTTT